MEFGGVSYIVVPLSLWDDLHDFCLGGITGKVDARKSRELRYQILAHEVSDNPKELTDE